MNNKTAESADWKNGIVKIGFVNWQLASRRSGPLEHLTIQADMLY